MDGLREKVVRLKTLLLARAQQQHKAEDAPEYEALRAELVATPAVRAALPKFVLDCGTIPEFWDHIRDMFEDNKYKRRREYLREQFQRILSALEEGKPLQPQPLPTAHTMSTSKPRPDVVLVTVNEHETRAVHDAFLAATGGEGKPFHLEERLYHDLGVVGGTTVHHAISEMGSGGSGGMQQTVERAIQALDPGAVIAVGIAFGVNATKQAIGDVIVSKLLRLYELQRLGQNSQIVLRGARPDAPARLLSHFRGFAQTAWRGQRPVRIGVMLTGEKLIDDQDYRDQLVGFESEAEGGEMEGAGLYVSASDNKVDWIVVKAICDWADGNKGVDKTARQQLAAKNAAEFVVQSLQYAPLKRTGATAEHSSSSALPQGGTHGAHASNLIAIHKRRLGVLEKQAAMHGALTPPHITLEVEDIRRILSGLEN